MRICAAFSRSLKSNHSAVLLQAPESDLIFEGFICVIFQIRDYLSPTDGNLIPLLDM